MSQKSLFCLKQFCRQWYLTLHQNLTEIGFKLILYNPLNNRVYVWKELDMLFVVSLYVNYIILASDDIEMMSRIQFCLQQKMKDVGEAFYVLGIRITMIVKYGKYAWNKKII